MVDNKQVKLYVADDVDNGIVLTQRINPDISNYLAGKPYTLAYYNAAGTVVKVVSDTYPDGSVAYDGANFALGNLRGNVYRSAGALATVRIWLPSGTHATYGLGRIALYEGAYTVDTVPEYIPKGYAAELAECQRYYINVGEETWLVGHYTHGTGGPCLFFPYSNMRIVPSVNYSTIQAFDETGTWRNFSSFYTQKTAQGINVILNVGDALSYFSVGDSMLIRGVKYLSAEL